MPYQEAQAPAPIFRPNPKLNSLQNAIATLDSTDGSTYSLDLPYDLDALRASYLERQALKVLAESKNYKGVESSYQIGSAAEYYINDINSKYLIKPIKATIPTYYNSKTGSIQLQLDDGLDDDVENDTIVYQHSQKKKFLSQGSIDPSKFQLLNNRRYLDNLNEKLSGQTTSVLCQDSNVIFSTSVDTAPILK